MSLLGPAQLETMGRAGPGSAEPQAGLTQSRPAEMGTGKAGADPASPRELHPLLLTNTHLTAFLGSF